MRHKLVMDEAAGSVEVLASSIKTLSEGVTKLLHSGLNERAIVLLLADCCPATVGKKQIIAVLRALENLKHEFLEGE